MASASAWAGLEEYLQHRPAQPPQGRGREPGPRSRRARARPSSARPSTPRLAGAAPGASRPLPAARNGGRFLRRRARDPGQPDDGGDAARPRRAGRRQHGAGAGAARPRVAAGARLFRQGPRRLDPAGRRPALGSGQPVAGRGDQADAAQRQPSRPRCSTRPGHQVGHQTGWNARAGAGAAPQARAALGGARGDVGELGERSRRRRLRVLPRRVGAAAGARQRRGRPTAAVFRVIPGDPHPFPWIRVMFNAALCRSWFGRGPWDRVAAAVARAARPGAATARRRRAGPAQHGRDARYRRGVHARADAGVGRPAGDGDGRSAPGVACRARGVRAPGAARRS